MAQTGRAVARRVRRMASPWTDEWVVALDRAARDDAGLREASRGRRVVIGQTVVDGEDVHRWHLVLDDGEVAVRPGPAEHADVSFTQDAAVASAVARGERSARSAFIVGDIQVGGDVSKLIELGPVLAGLGDVFAAVRDEVPGGGRDGSSRPERDDGPPSDGSHDETS